MTRAVEATALADTLGRGGGFHRLRRGRLLGDRSYYSGK